MEWDSNIHYFKNYRPIKSEESKDQKDPKAKETYKLSAINNNSRDGSKGQSSQTFD